MYSSTSAAVRPSTPGSPSAQVARHPVERHQQRRRVMHEVEQIIKPAARIGRRPTVKLGLHLRYPPAWTQQAPGQSAAIRRRVLRHCRIHPFAKPLPPFAMRPAFPTSDYYGGSAPPGPFSGRRAYPARRTGGAPDESRDRMVPVFTVVRSSKEEPDCVQRHRHEYTADLPRGLPDQLSYTDLEDPHHNGNGGKAPRSDPHRQVRAGVLLRDVKRRFLAYSSSSRSPDPPHLAVLARPGVIGAACHHPRRHPDQAAPSFNHLLRQAKGDGLSPPLEPQRLTAQTVSEVDPSALSVASMATCGGSAQPLRRGGGVVATESGGGRTTERAVEVPFVPEVFIPA